VSVGTETNFGVGYYWTAEGKQAVVDAVADGLLIGRINLQEDLTKDPHWTPKYWQLDGTCMWQMNKQDRLRTDRVQRIKQTFWVNIYPSGPGQLRKDWEEALVEASRCEEPCLCRVEVKVDAFVGEGLK
jgi:hypothetical protein